MELNIPNPDARFMAEAFGIDPEREAELECRLEELWMRNREVPVATRWHHLVADIAFFCNGPEELSWCLIVECAWLQKMGRRIA